MDVRIQQPRHQGPPLAINDPGLPRGGGPARGPDPADQAILDDDPHPRLGVAAGTVEQRRMLEDHVHGPTSLSTPRCRAKRGRWRSPGEITKAAPSPSPRAS